MAWPSSGAEAPHDQAKVTFSSDIPIAFVVFRPEIATGRIIHERLLGGELTEKHA